ncbi:helix-turn-helix domain-containing protein [Burkholderia cenocepacia]|uniref:helix-turn-helix domain-containing protein n=1 Tax=Burkholderia cenocepacia TaxID=95486 RepID=UPI002012623E|nr:helix-turn-helix transcriptional regulator [Burkholderia cenocepacia]
MPNDNVLTDKQRGAISSGIAALERLGWTGPAVILRALLATPQPEPRAEVTEEQPSLTNPLTPYGMLVRALRIVSGTTLMEMAKALLTTPAKLSAMEFGRTPVTPEFAFDVSAYFDALGVPHTASALRAAIEAPPLFKRQEES